MILDTWAKRWGINPDAIEEFKRLMGLTHQAQPTPFPATSEAAVQQRIRLAAAGRGILLWRNNNGAMMDADGRMIRYGLANDSKKMNEYTKSSDLIGITPYVVTVGDIGKTHGIFTSIEVKKEGWQYKNTPREQAQFRWLTLVTSKGGLAQFATSPEDIK